MRSSSPRTEYLAAKAYERLAAKISSISNKSQETNFNPQHGTVSAPDINLAKDTADESSIVQPKTFNGNLNDNKMPEEVIPVVDSVGNSQKIGGVYRTSSPNLSRRPSYSSGYSSSGSSARLCVTSESPVHERCWLQAQLLLKKREELVSEPKPLQVRITHFEIEHF